MLGRRSDARGYRQILRMRRLRRDLCLAALFLCGRFLFTDARRIIGKSGDAVKELMGEACEPELIRRDNLARII